MVNKVILVGRLGKDPLVRRTENNLPVATFTMATSEYYKDKEGNRQEKTEWHNIVAWRGLAEVAEKFLRKGSLIYIEGKITSRSYEKDGATRYITEIVADNLQMLGAKTGADTPLPPEPVSSSSYTKSNAFAESNADFSGAMNDPGDSDDLPF